MERYVFDRYSFKQPNIVFRNHCNFLIRFGLAAMPQILNLPIRRDALYLFNRPILLLNPAKEGRLTATSNFFNHNTDRTDVKTK